MNSYIYVRIFMLAFSKTVQSLRTVHIWLVIKKMWWSR